MHLRALGARVACAHCGADLCATGENVHAHLALREAASGERFALGGRYAGSERFRLRHFYCPGCATQVDVQVALKDEPLLAALSTN